MNALSKLKENYNLSTKELAFYLNIDRTQMQKLLDNTQTEDLAISFGLLIAKKFNLTIDELVNLDKGGQDVQFDFKIWTAILDKKDQMK